MINNLTDMLKFTSKLESKPLNTQ